MSKKAIGIDLGTSKCCVGVVRDGKVEILENERGNKTTPSYVAFTDTERLVGDDAKDQATLNPANTVSGVKRFMCVELNDSAKMSPKNAIKVEGDTYFHVTYKKNPKKILLPQQISAMLLTKMKSLAEDHLKSSVEEAVISVPASFSNAQRQATKDAASIAGLKVLALIDEPTAAAIAYQTNRRSKGKETIVVVDFGAGKLDVSVVTVDDGYIHVKGVSGSTDIGGNDVDEMLMSHIIDEYKKNISKHDPQLGGGVEERLRSSSENIKRKISLLPKVQETIDCFGEANIFRITMSREEFNKMLPTKIRKCLVDCLEDALKVASLDPEKISRVLVVGGSTRLLVIHEWLQEFFKLCPIDRSVNPDEAVAVGAAVQAALLSRDHEVKELDVKGATGTKFYLQQDDSTLPVNLFHPKYFTAAPSKQFLLTNDPIRMHRYHHVFEEFIGRKKSYPRIGSFLYSSDLCLRVDKCGIFGVSARVGTNRDKSYKMEDILQNVPGKLHKEKLQKLVEEEEKFREDGQEEECRTEAMSKLESLCFRYQSDLQKNQVTESFPEPIHRFAKHVEENINWLNVAASVSVTKCRERKEFLEHEYREVLEEIRRHIEQVEKERVAAVTDLVKCCLKLPFPLPEGDMTLKEVGLLDTQEGLHELIVKWAVPNCPLTKEDCVKCIEALRCKIVQHNDAKRETGTKASANDTRHGHTFNVVRTDESIVNKSNPALPSPSSQSTEIQEFKKSFDNPNPSSSELQEAK